MKKIIFITRSSERGGEAIFIKKIADSLKDKYFIKVISFLNAKNNKSQISLKPNYILNKPIPNISSIRTLKQEIKIADISQHFIFDIYSILFFFVCYFYNKNIICTFHTYIDGKKLYRFILDPLIKFISINLLLFPSKRYIFITNHQMCDFRRFCIFKKIFDKKSIFIYNFIKSKNVRFSKINSNKKTLNVIFVGRSTKIKGFNDLIELADKTKEDNIKFKVVSDFPLKHNFRKYSNLDFRPELSNDLLIKEYDSCNILILPSYSETFGLVILEAMARGLVVLASDLPSIREYFIDGRNGYLFPPGDINKMKKIIIYLKNNPSEIERISKNNLKDIWKFTAEKQVPKYIKVYEEVLNEKIN